MVFQNYALYPHLTAHDNIGFSLSMRGVPKTERKPAVREAAEVLGLTEVLNRRRVSSPAASASALRWDGRSCASRRSS